MTLRRGALVAVLLAARAGAALELNATLGGGYSRSDLWYPGGYDRQPAWDWLAAGSISGSPLRPGILTLDAGADYRSMRSMYFTGASQSDSLAYHGQASLFSQSFLPVSVRASRSSEDFSSDVPGSRPGATLVTSEGANVQLRADGLPVLRAGLTRSDLVTRALGIPESTSSTTSLNAGAAQSLSAFEYDLAYDTYWGMGSLDETNYRSHNVMATSLVRPTAGTEVRLSERYFLRAPTVSAAFSPKVDDNALSVGGSWKGQATRSSLSYTYVRALTTAPGALDQELLAHGVAYATDWLLSKELQVTTSANVDFSDSRLGDEELRAAGQSLGASVQWSRKVERGVSPSLAASATGGVIEPSDGTAQLAYGAGIGGGLAASWRGVDLCASYNLSFSSNLGARLGASLGQALTLSGRTALRKVILDFQLQGSATRRNDPLLGAFLNRNVNANLNTRWSWMRFGLNAALTSGLDPSVSAGPSDGLFIPARYNSNSYVVGGQVGAEVVRHLTTSLVARWLRLELAGRDPQHERSLALQVGYQAGQFLFTMEERYAVGGLEGYDRTGNSFFVRVTRAFNARL